MSKKTSIHKLDTSDLLRWRSHQRALYCKKNGISVYGTMDGKFLLVRDGETLLQVDNTTELASVYEKLQKEDNKLGSSE